MSITVTKRDPYHWGTMSAALLLSIWVLVCPWVIAEAGVPPAALNFHIAGGLAAILCAVAIVRTDDLPGYGVLAVAAWLAVSPWILDLSEAATRQSVFYAIFLAGMAWVGRPSFKPKNAES